MGPITVVMGKESIPPQKANLAESLQWGPSPS